MFGQFALIVMLFGQPDDGGWRSPRWLRQVSTLVEITGSIAIVAAAVQLGTRLRIHPAPSAQAVLRTTGAYRHVRHPIYSGLFLVSVARLLSAGSVRHLVVALALVGVVTCKAREEERLLTQRFPQYRDYLARTGRFVPRVRGHPAAAAGGWEAATQAMPAAEAEVGIDLPAERYPYDGSQ